MYKWKIKITLKNGEWLEGLITADKNDSKGLFAEMLYNENDEPYEFIGILDMTGTHNIVIRVSEIAVLDVLAYK